MSDDEMYSRYLRAWRTYLRRINGTDQDSFREKVRGGLPPDKADSLSRRGGFSVWPEVWPEVEYWFGDRDTFTRAVEAAEKP